MKDAKQNEEKKRSNPLISILMPVYNEEKFIVECVRSVVNQDFTDWELLIIDDHSTDNTVQILGQCFLDDSRITLLENDEKGIIPALRKAFSVSRGRLITRMDGDDIMPSGKLRSLSSTLLKLGPGHLVSGKVKYFSESELGEGFLKYESWINRQAYYRDIYKECTLPSACWMSFKSDLLKIHAFEVSQYPEDYDLLFKFYETGLKIVGLDQILHLWRDHPERASRNDPNYLDQTFFHLKVHYFMKIDRDFEVPLVVWGAGRKGKSLVKHILAWQKFYNQKEDIIWITGNQKKVGHNIYGITLQSQEILTPLNQKQILISISDPAFEKDKENLYERYDLNKNKVFEFT